jgi:putative inorganic carbon (HCO3(-)) transporter
MSATLSTLAMAPAEGTHVLRVLSVRALCIAACAGVIVYVGGPLFAQGELPLVVRLAWPAAIAGAWRWPRASLVLWLAAAPLLPVAPALLGWPPFSLPSAWLAALALPAWVRVVRQPEPPALPRAGACWLLIASASLLVVLGALRGGKDDLGPFLFEVHRYLWNDLLTTTTQRPVLAPILAWAVVAEGMLVLWLVAITFRDGSRTRQPWVHTATTAMVVAASAVGVWSVWQRWTERDLLLNWVELDPYMVRVNASFTDVNALGAYLASLLPLVLAMIAGAGTRAWRLACGSAAAAVVAGILFTGSRAAWGAAAIATTGFVLGLLRWRLVDWSPAVYRTIARAAAVAAVVVAVALMGLSAWATARDVRLYQQRSYRDALLHTLNLRASADERFKGRPQLWAAAVRMVTAEPLTGVGIGRYFKVVYAWAPRQEELPRPQENAHNYFLQVAAETGWPGLVAFLALLGLAFSSSARTIRSTAPIGTRRLALALACGITAFAVSLLTGHSLLLHEGQITFWPLVGAAVLLGRAWSPPREGRAAWQRWVVPVAALLLLVTLPMRGEAEPAGNVVRTRGLFDEEVLPDGTTFRWTGSSATIEVPAEARVVTLEARFAAPFPQSMQVRCDDALIDNVPPMEGHWLTLRYTLPPDRTGSRSRRFELNVTPTWTRDGREVGVMIGRIEWAP